MSHAESLERVFAVVRGRAVRLGLINGLAVAALTALAVCGLFAWLDLLWELSPQVRLAAIWLAAIAAALQLARVLRGVFRDCRNHLLANRLDRAGQTGGQIRSGYDLADEIHPTAATSAAASVAVSPAAIFQSELRRGLARLSLARACQLAAGISPVAVISSRAARLAATAFGGALVIVLGMAIFMPRLAATQWLRFSDPFGDHPPYSQVSIAVEPGNGQVLYGHEFEVRASTAGPPVDQLEMVLLGSAGEREETLPMFPESEGHWRGIVSKVTAPVQYFVRTGRARSHHYNLGVIMVPKLENVRFRVTPPAYTHRPSYDGPLPQGGISGLKGTIVEVWAKSNRPLAAGSLNITTGDKKSSVDLHRLPGDEQQVAGRFTIAADGRFELDVVDVEGHASQENFAAALTLLKDESPIIRILQPERISLATPNAVLPVVLAGEDDYGISHVQLFRSLNQSRALPLDFSLPTIPKTRFDGSEALPLAAYGLEAGDVIKLYGRIEDNDPDGAKGSETPVVEVRIISQEEFERMLRIREGLEVMMSKYRAAERRLESLKTAEDGLRRKMKQSPGNAATPSDRAELKRLAEQLREDSDEIEKSAQHLLPYDADHKLSKRLERLAAALSKMAHKASDLDSEQSLSHADIEKLLDDLDRQLGGERGDLQSGALEPLEALEKIYPLIEDQARFISLYQQQRDLADRLAALQGHDKQDNPREKARMRDLEAEQRRIRKDMEQLLDDIENHLQQLPDAPALEKLRSSARAFVDAARSSGGIESMADAEAGLSDFSGTRGYTSAKKAADELEKLISRSQSMPGEGKMACLVFRPSLGEVLGNTIEQLLGEQGLPTDGRPQTGGGYSSRANTSSNTGLYGQLPGGQPFGGHDKKPGASGGGDVAAGHEYRANEPGDAASMNDVSRASGSASVPVPARHRSRVAAYLERILEEQPDDNSDR